MNRFVLGWKGRETCVDLACQTVRQYTRTALAANVVRSGGAGRASPRSVNSTQVAVSRRASGETADVPAR